MSLDLQGMDSSHAITEETRQTLIEPFFVQDGVCPLEKVKWTSREVPELGNGKKHYVEAPEDWSLRSVSIAAIHYIAPADKDSIRSLLMRVVNTLHQWVLEDGLFRTTAKAQVLRNEVAHILLKRMGSFNSPIYYNLGIEEKPLVSACFINSVDDSMESITDLGKTEARIFQRGAGAGCNWSKLRSSHEKVRGMGNSSGPVSFMVATDMMASKIKSGGRKRRAARMDILNVDHPDIMEFVRDKANTEELARKLVEQGWSTKMEDPRSIHNMLPHQSTNLSVRIFDRFMEAALAGKEWPLTYRSKSGVHEVLDARTLLHQIAQATWECGDPGIQFHDTINGWSTLQDIETINGSNPCQPDFAPVLTPEGIRTFADIKKGSTIWSGKQWTKVVKKWRTGVKPVYRYHTRAGVFVGTENHNVISQGDRIEVQEAQTIDISVLDCTIESQPLESRDVLDGLMLGDGSIIHANDGANLYPVLTVGDKDRSYFRSEVDPFVNPTAYDSKENKEGSSSRHRVEGTTLTPEELPRTYERKVPLRFLQGSRPTICGFLRGLYSANGSICGGRVTLKATSFHVIEAVQQMLSAVGIRSYYTVNKPKDVEFENGVYTCKQSYDLNITVDRCRFAHMIGFIQPEKTLRLAEACKMVSSKPSKTSYEVVEVEYLDDLPVWDITVEADEHTYWTGGLLVSNCGEYVGVDDSSCNLASINVLPPDRGPLTHDELRHITKVFITCMDSIAGHAGYPTEKIGQNAVAYRALGLGWTNLGALAMNNGYPYDSHEARRMAAEIASVTTATAYEQSIELAKRTKPFHRAEECHVGICTVFNKHYRAALQAFGPENAVVEQWKALVKQVEDRNYPRNSAVSLCAPCGTIGFLMDNETTGCEPGIALKAIKKLSYGGEMTLVLRTVEPALQRLGYTKDQIAAVLEQVEGDGHVEGMVKKEHLAIFDTAIPTGPTERAISAMGHLKMLEAIQPHLSMAMSKTVNLPNTATVDEIEDTIIQSWKMGIKCLSIFRDGCKAFQPIAPTKDKATEAIKALTWGDRKRLPNTRNSVTTKIDMSGTELYMTVGLFEDGTPGELFFVAGKHGATLAGLLDSFAIAVSHALQYGCSISALADKFKGIRFAPEGWSDGHHYKSIIDYVAHWLDNRYCKTEEEVEGGNGHGKVHAGSIAEALRSPLLVDLSNREVCARCGEFMYQAGGSNCHMCHGCGSVSGGCG